jgi:hypothetical protein
LKTQVKIVLTVVLVFVVLIIVGAAEMRTEPTSTPKPTSTGDMTPSPTSQSLNQAITITGTSQELSQIGTEKPSLNNIFLEVNITITNNGYNSFVASEMLFSAEVNNVKYQADAGAIRIVNNWSNPTLQNKETYGGTLVFQIPKNSNTVTYSYNDFVDTYNINWNIQPL